MLNGAIFVDSQGVCRERCVCVCPLSLPKKVGRGDDLEMGFGFFKTG